MPTTESAAIIVVLRRQRPDSEYQGPAGRVSGGRSGVATLFGPLVGGGFKLGFIGVVL